MPKKSYRRPQCGWTEGGRRCIRDAVDTQTNLCRPHLLVAAEAQRRAQHAAARAPTGNPLSDLIGDLAGDFFAGRPFDFNRVGQVLNETGFGFGGIFGGGYSPPIDNEPPPFVPPEERERARWSQHQERGQPPPPSFVPEQVARARNELGFGPADRLTLEMVKERRRQLSRKWHPDLAQDERKRKVLTEKMSVINHAADVLEQALAKQTA